MGGSTWVQDKTELFEGELVVFKRPNSPNWYMRVYVARESKHYQKSLRTKSQFEAIEKAKKEYKILQQKVAKEEKVFTITFGEAIDGYYEIEKARERRGMIRKDWLQKKYQYIKNTFAPYFGLDQKVNSVADKQMEEYIDMRLSRCKRKQTIQQEITIIKHFYKIYLIKKGFVFKVPEFPEFKVTKKDRSRRTDTFSRKEFEGLLMFMLEEWCFRSTDERYQTMHRVRVPVKTYGKKDNKQKHLNEMEWDMELHRRHLLLYGTMLASLTGLRCPSELFNLRWSDIEFRAKNLDCSWDMLQSMDVLPGEYMTDLCHSGKNPKAVNIQMIFEEWACNDTGEKNYCILHIRDGKTGSRTVPGLLSGLFRQIQEYFTFMGYPPDESSDAPVFMELFGRRKFHALDKYAFNRMWRELMRDAGLNRIHFTPYHIRHYFITQRIRALGAKVVPLLAKACGNSVPVIFSTYEHIILEDDMEDLYRK